MKSKIFFLVLLIGFATSCNKNDEVDHNFLFGTWITDSEYGNVSVTFISDMTYTRTAYLESFLPGGIPSTPPILASITGTWEFKDNQITFLTANVELPDLPEYPDIETTPGVPIGSFYGEVLTPGNIKFSEIITIGDERTYVDMEYIPEVWTLISISKDEIIVDNPINQVKFIKSQE